MHTGQAVERDGDWSGATVNLAARVSAAAAGDEALLTATTNTAAGEEASPDVPGRPLSQRQWQS
jgi:class 3 adenylate cyclase